MSPMVRHDECSTRKYVTAIGRSCRFLCALSKTLPTRRDQPDLACYPHNCRFPYILNSSLPRRLNMLDSINALFFHDSLRSSARPQINGMLSPEELAMRRMIVLGGLICFLTLDAAAFGQSVTAPPGPTGYNPGARNPAYTGPQFQLPFQITPIPVAPILVRRDSNAPAPLNMLPAPALSARLEREIGLKITKVEDAGPAAAGLLRTGDIILGIGTTRTQSYDDALRTALTPLNGDAEVVFINAESGKVEKLLIKIANGRASALHGWKRSTSPSPPRRTPCRRNKPRLHRRKSGFPARRCACTSGWKARLTAMPRTCIQLVMSSESSAQREPARDCWLSRLPSVNYFERPTPYPVV